MSAEASTHADSAVSMQDMEIAQLNEHIEQLQLHNNALQGECSEWKYKHQSLKDEVFQLTGASSKHGRLMKELDDRFSNAKSQLEVQINETNKLKDDLGKAQKCTREAELHAEAMQNSSGTSRRDSGQFTATELDLQRANKLLQEQVLLAQEQLLEATRDSRKHEAKVLEHEETMEKYRTQIVDHENTIATYRTNEEAAEELIADLQAKIENRSPSVACSHFTELYCGGGADDAGSVSHEPSSPPLDVDSNYADSNYAGSVSLSLSAQIAPPSIPSSGTTSPVPTAPGVSPTPSGSGVSPTPTDSGAAANVIVNIQPAEQNNWGLIKRIQSAITKASKLNFVGPEDVVAELQAEMERLDLDHTEQTAAAEHWQKVALAALAEVDSLRTEYEGRPLCVVAGHRALADELEARTVQLQIQSTLVAQWQKKMVTAQEFIEESNEEMREAGMKGI
jgi:hypothetical protein